MTLHLLTPALATHRGMRRKHNEDAVGYQYPANAEQLASHGALFIVADGVGGLSAGDRASQMAVDLLTKHYYATDALAPVEERLVAAVQQTNRDIFEQLDSKAATTLVAIVVIGQQLYATSIGDSAIFLIREGTIEQINEQDVLENPATEQEKSVLTKAIGYREDLEVQTITGSIQVEDRLLLCSDGLTRYVDEAVLLRLCQSRDPRDGVRRMLMEANNAGGADNISAVLVQIGEELPPQDVVAHADKLNAFVAVDNDPLMPKPVETKPHTQIPMARPEPVVPDLPLVKPQPPAAAAPQPAPSYVPQGPTPQAPPPPRADNSRTILIVLALVVLVMGALLIGGALFSQSSPVPVPTEAATLEPTAPQAVDEEATTAPEATATDDNPTPNEQAATDTGLAIGTLIEVSESAITRDRVGVSEENGAAFPTSPGGRYEIQDIFADTNNEGQLWYRLLDEENNQSGWLPASELPDYIIISSD